MIATAVAVMCRLLVVHPTILPDRDCTAEEARVEEIVTDSDRDEHFDLFSCYLHSQIAIADWKKNHPIYFKAGWRIARIKCVPGHYVVRGSV